MVADGPVSIRISDRSLRFEQAERLVVSRCGVGEVGSTAGLVLAGQECVVQDAVEPVRGVGPEIVG